MSVAVEAPAGEVWAAFIWKVSHKNAPGAIKAMAFIVTPPRLRVFFNAGDFCVCSPVESVGIYFPSSIWQAGNSGKYFFPFFNE